MVTNNMTTEMKYSTRVINTFYCILLDYSIVMFYNLKPY